MRDPDEPPTHDQIVVQHRTYVVLNTVRMDESKTFDMVIRDLLRYRYGPSVDL